jgi:hypothetical protein
MRFNDPEYQPSRWNLPGAALTIGQLDDPFAPPQDFTTTADRSVGQRFAQAPVSSDTELSATEIAVMRLVGMGWPPDPAPRPGDGSLEPGSAFQGRPIGGKLSTDNTPIPFMDAYGNPVLKPNGEPMMIPRGVDPLFFVNRGLADASAGPWAVIRGLLKFGQGRDWDLQRQGPDDTVDQDFVDAATVALGLYASAAGVYPNDLLRLQSFYAMFNSDFGDAEVSPKYEPLPVTNVKNTQRGYDLYRSGRIGPTPAAP